MQSDNPVGRASRIGQSIWLDFLSRELLDSGRLKRFIDLGLRGITSNPKIFDSAISEGREYDAPIRRFSGQGKTPMEIYERLAVEDIQNAADQLRPSFNDGLPHDGFVSLEVSPHLAFDANKTIEEGKRLWAAVDRPNVLIKVPATEPGLEAIRALIGEGVSVNVTLLFSLPRYRETATAYIRGLEDALAAGRDVSRIHSVASFFLSRIDVLVDKKLDAIKGERRDLAQSLRGEVAVASAKSAYQDYLRIFNGDRFEKLRERGAQPQRLLWASTSTKDPQYSDVKYANALVGPDTVDTLPEDTFLAFVDHGVAENVLGKEPDEADKTLAGLAEVGIDIDQVTAQLLDEGVDKFIKPFDSLIGSLEKKMAA